MHLFHFLPIFYKYNRIYEKNEGFFFYLFEELVLFRVYIIFPEWKTAALNRTVVINGASCIFPENTVVTGFFYKTDKRDAAGFNYSAVLFEKGFFG